MMPLKQRALPETSQKDFYVNVSAATTSAALDSVFFHPLETCVRRVQLNECVFPHSGFRVAHLPGNLYSLFQGMLMTNVLKVAHRSIKYAGEPLIVQQIRRQSPDSNPVLQHTLGGAATGIAAICLTPLDTLKVKKQRSHNRAVSYQHLWAAQAAHPWHAVSITLVRNTLGAGAFFACNSYLIHYVFRLGDSDRLTTQQKLMNSVMCPAVGILASYPADLIKTHMQAAETNASGVWQTAAQLTVTGGLRALYRGLIPKLVTQAPRGAVSFFLYQSLQEQLCLYAEDTTSSPVFFKANSRHKASELTARAAFSREFKK